VFYGWYRCFGTLAGFGGNLLYLQAREWLTVGASERPNLIISEREKYTAPFFAELDQIERYCYCSYLTTIIWLNLPMISFVLFSKYRFAFVLLKLSLAVLKSL
jgi:hypothetical protein